MIDGFALLLDVV